MIGNKIANKITNVSKSSQSNSEAVRNEHDKEIPNEKITHDLRLE